MDETRRQMIEIGARLLRQQGFNATTLMQVVEKGGLPRGSIYHHFPEGKAELAREALAHASADIAADLARVAQRASSAGEAIDSYVTMLADRLEASGYLDGCWFATTALEVAPNDANLMGPLNEEFDRWRTAIATALAHRGIDPKRAGPCADLLLASIQGGLLIARVHCDTAVLRGLIPYLRAVVDDS